MWVPNKDMEKEMEEVEATNNVGKETKQQLWRAPLEVLFLARRCSNILTAKTDLSMESGGSVEDSQSCLCNLLAQ